MIRKGSKVRWQSQAGGTWKEKAGTVVAVVPPRGDPNRALAEAGERGRIREPGMERDHVSYVVRAGGRIYWPVAAKLEEVAS